MCEKLLLKISHPRDEMFLTVHTDLRNYTMKDALILVFDKNELTIPTSHVVRVVFYVFTAFDRGGGGEMNDWSDECTKIILNEISTNFWLINIKINIWRQTYGEFNSLWLLKQS